jgi:hypothetical protein
MFLLVARPLHFAGDAGGESHAQFNRICWGQQRMEANNGGRIGALKSTISAMAA